MTQPPLATYINELRGESLVTGVEGHNAQTSIAYLCTKHGYLQPSSGLSNKIKLIDGPFHDPGVMMLSANAFRLLTGVKMALWYRRVDDRMFQTMDLVPEFLDIWLQTRRPQDINTDNLAGVIDALYDFQPVPGQWIVIEVRPQELANYINVYINAKGKKKPMMSARDTALSRKYAELLKKGYEPTPIMIAGAGDKTTGEEGIVLIDGRHRIFSAIAAEVQTILAYIPLQDLSKMDAAIIKL